MDKSFKRYLRSIILEQVDELFSAPDASEETTRLEKDSADDQIDSFIIKFEKDSIKLEDDTDELSESLSRLSLRVLLEQDEEAEDDAAAEPTDDAADEDDAAEPQEPAGSEDTEEDVKPETPPKPPLDIDAFTKRVARLAMNYDTLLDIKTVIVNRAMNFLLENYDQVHSDEMRDILDTQFDFDLDGGKEDPAAPFAVGAFQGGTGQMGGGGA